MSLIETAVKWALSIAADSSHGYDQTNRWGPDYDCSSLVISAWAAAGAPVKTNGATYTGNMRTAFLASGFADVTGQISLPTGSGLVRGDVLLNTVHHTALYIGDGQIVHAAGNEKGGITGGQTGDQTGGEICTRSYYNYPWDCVLRYTAESTTADQSAGGTYTVQSGDTLSGIALKLLGDAQRYAELAALNGISDPSKIYPGQVLVLPGGETETEPAGAIIPVIQEGDAGGAVLSLQTLLVHKWAISCGPSGADGEFGPDTAAAVKIFQAAHGLDADGVCGDNTWKSLLN